MDEELTEAEREQMRKTAALLKVSAGIASKWVFAWFLVGAGLFAGFSAYLVQRAARSTWRYEAQTRLIYMPRQEGKAPTLGDKQLLRVLERQSLKKRVAEVLPLPKGEASQLMADLSIKQEGRPSNLFTLTAHSGSRVAAIRKVNAYADVLLTEYADYRAEELTRWGAAAEARRESMQVELSDIEEEMAALETRVGTPRPVAVLTSLTTLIGDQRRNAVMLDVDIATEEERRATLEAELGEAGTAILERTPDIRRLMASMESLDEEIAKLREVYTDLNPKVKGKLEDREALEKQYRDILEEYGAGDAGAGALERAEKNATAMLEAQSRAAALRETRAALGDALAANEERAAELTEVAPRMTVLSGRRAELLKELKDLEQQVGSEGYLRESARGDLRQIERAERADDRSPLQPKNFILGAAGSVVCTGALALWTIVLGLWWGKVRGAQELAANGDVEVLGSLPRRWALRQHVEKDAMGVVAMNFVNANAPKGVVLLCRLRGAKHQPKFLSVLEWSLSMSGIRLFLLDVVQNADFEAVEGAETLLNTVKKGPAGWFPVVNRYALAPTELQMLRADLAALKAEFDCILVSMPGGLRRGGKFLSQLLSVCDSALVVVGADKSRRRELRYVRRMALLAGKPMMGLVTGAKGRVVRREMEASKW